MGKLTKKERDSLANQNRILASMCEQNENHERANYYSYLADIAEFGIEELYYELLDNLPEDVNLRAQAIQELDGFYIFLNYLLEKEMMYCEKNKDSHICMTKDKYENLLNIYHLKKAINIPQVEIERMIDNCFN